VKLGAHLRLRQQDPTVLARTGAQAECRTGIGEVTRPGDKHDAREATELANAIRSSWSSRTRLGSRPSCTRRLCTAWSPSATSFPQAIALAASFDPGLAEEIFTVAARQTRARGVSQVLAPVVDVARDPRWGRIEENLWRGSVPGRAHGVAAVNGLQGRRESADAPIDGAHVMATLKHMTGTANPRVAATPRPPSPRRGALREVFLPPFEAAIREAHALSVMASYNEIDGVPSHENRWLITDVLRGEWGFAGVVVSDYFGVALLKDTHHVVADLPSAGRVALEAGVDIELPEPGGYGSLVADLHAGRIKQATLDQAVARVLRAKFLLGLFEQPYVQNTTPEPERPADRALALRAAEEAMVLLKNDGGLLPLEKAKVKSVAVIGPTADTCHLGGYSGKPDKTVSILDGLRAKLGDRVKVSFAQGCGLTTGNRGWNDDKVTLSDPADDARLVAEAGKTGQDRRPQCARARAERAALARSVGREPPGRPHEPRSGGRADGPGARGAGERPAHGGGSDPRQPAGHFGTGAKSTGDPRRLLPGRRKPAPPSRT